MSQVSVQPATMSIDEELELLTNSAYLLALEQEISSKNPILSLDPDYQIAFVLHHILDYKIEEAALLLEMSDQKFRWLLRGAYLQLAAVQFEPDVHFDESALA